MPEQRRPDVLENAANAKVKIAPPAESGDLDLAAELQDDLADVELPETPDPQLALALGKLKEGTKKGLSPRDHQDLGVAYLNMGLVDEAIDEFTAAKKEPKKKGAKAKKTVKAAAAKKAPKKLAKKASKKPAKKLAAKKVKPKAKKAASKKSPKKAAKKTAKKTAKKPNKKKAPRKAKR